MEEDYQEKIEHEFDLLYKCLMHQSRTLMLFNSILLVPREYDYYENLSKQKFSYKFIEEIMFLVQNGFASATRRFIELLVKTNNKGNCLFYYQFCSINKLRTILEITKNDKLNKESESYKKIMKLKKNLEFYYLHNKATDFKVNTDILSDKNINISYNFFANKILNISTHAFVSSKEITSTSQIEIPFCEIEIVFFGDNKNQNKHIISKNELNIDLSLLYN